MLSSSKNDADKLEIINSESWDEKEDVLKEERMLHVRLISLDNRGLNGCTTN